MNETILIEMVVRLISSSGAATFDTLRRELESAATPEELRRALQIACGRGLLEADVPRRSAADQGYRLPPGRAINLSRVLEVLADFDQFGGASVELVAWELSVEVSAVQAGWSRAVAAGLVEPAGTDQLHQGERLWRLTEAGRRAMQSNCGAAC